ncbi:MAG: rhomboid family intramembrane serine protease [Terriglobales bacterium]
MGTLVPLSDASRRPRHFPVVTALIVAINVIVFIAELMRGDAFVAQWSVVPADIVAGHHWITILTAMFLHGSWSHIIGNMVFLWAFGPEIEDAMNPLRYAVFYLVGGLVAMLAQVAASPHSTVPNLGASGAIAAVMGAFLVTYPRDRMRSLLVIFIFVRITFIPAALLIGVWFLIQLINAGAVANVQTGGVAYLAHIGGLTFGAVTARLFEDPRRLAEQMMHRPVGNLWPVAHSRLLLA